MNIQTMKFDDDLMTHLEKNRQLVLVINPGSSNLKWAVYDVSTSDFPLEAGKENNADFKDLLVDVSARYAFYMVVLRVVHGGQQFFEPLLVTKENFQCLKALNQLAPLHNPVSMEAIEQIQQYDDELPIVAVFDTAFFRNLPRVAQVYGLPVEIVKKYQLRRYGFHGFAHKSMLDQWLTSPSNKQRSGKNHHKIITVQLGSGCSMAAILNGEPVDTTMGFTPNDGLLMRTRSGDIDPGLLTWLQMRTAWTPEKTDCILNQCSGWSGMSGGIDDMSKLLKDKSEESHLAFDLFCYRIRKTLGSYIAVLGGLDGIMFSGGISENNVDVCRQLLLGLEYFGIRLCDSLPPNPASIVDHLQLPVCITTEHSAVTCWIVMVDEAGAMLDAVKKSPLSINTL